MNIHASFYEGSFIKYRFVVFFRTMSIDLKLRFSQLCPPKKRVTWSYLLSIFFFGAKIALF